METNTVPTYRFMYYPQKVSQTLIYQLQFLLQVRSEHKIWVARFGTQRFIDYGRGSHGQGFRQFTRYAFVAFEAPVRCAASDRNAVQIGHVRGLAIVTDSRISLHGDE